IALLPGSRKQEIENILPTMLSAAGEIAQRVPGAQFLLAMAPNVAPEEVEEILRREQELGGAVALLKLMRQASGEINRVVGSALKAALTPSPKLATTEGLVLDSNPARTDEEGDARWTQHHKRPPAQSAPLVIVEGLTYDTMARADLVVAASGTATLEATILHKPMIIIYRGSRLMEAEWRLRRRALALDYIGLPNILAGKLVCPELIQEEATAKAIADHAVEMLLQPERLLHMKEKLASVVAENLGDRGAVRRAAKLILDKLETISTPADRNENSRERE
ncbi:MAG TPA: hypothetical protein VFW40_11825, partial [Capsulimonadaceae bacterium]|nr:hypothetical protein [Capsulimonadaceae bacterium]